MAPTIEKFSQFGEQPFILANTPLKGKFLDIGAWHPTIFSNTRALFDQGWSGVLIEPSPGPFLNLVRACSNCGDVPLELYGERKERLCEKCGSNRYGYDPRIVLICAAVGLDTGLVKLHITDDALSTSDEESYSKWEDKGGFFGTYYVPQITLEDIISQFGPFDFVNIDSEGTSVDILYRLLKNPMLPKCICVEHNERMIEIAPWAEAAGYKIVHLNGTNLVLAR